jgi:hypothetical protein
MDVARILGALRRRWYLVTIGLLMTMGLSLLAYQTVPFTYQASGSVLLLPPGYDKQNGSNPFLQLGGLELPASIVAAYLEGEGPQERAARVVPHATYTVAIDASTRGPVLSVIVVDRSEASTLLALSTVLDAIPAALHELQSQLKVGSGSTVGSMRLAVDTHPTVIRKATLRALVAVLAVGLVLTMMSTVAIDSLLDRPKKGRSRASVIREADPDGTATPGEPVNESEESAGRDGPTSLFDPDDEHTSRDPLSEEAFAELEPVRSR